MEAETYPLVPLRDPAKWRDASRSHASHHDLPKLVEPYTSTFEAGTAPFPNRFNKPAATSSAFSTHDVADPDARSLGRARRYPHWNPKWLHTTPLLAFTLLYGLLVVALVLLWHFSSTEDGFALLTTNHYAWTYGPTAIMVIVVSLWRQVDFWCKSLIPWQVLKRGNASAAESVLLDYVFPLQITTLWRAIRNGHFTVVATILGFMLLKLITVLSTGLLILQPNQRPPVDATLTATSVFNASTYHAAAITEAHITQSLKDTSIVYNAYALMAEGLSFPEGIKPTSVYQTFTPTNSSGNQANLTTMANVYAFYPYLDCEEADITLTMPSFDDTETQYFADINVTWASCTTSPDHPWSTTVSIKDPRYDSCPPRQLTGQKAGIDCLDESGRRQGDTVWLLTMTDIRYNQTLANGSVAAPGRNVQTTSWGIEIMPVTGIVCKPGYSMEKARVAYDYAQSPPQINVTGPLTQSGNKLVGFTEANLTLEVDSALSAAVTTLGDAVVEDLALDFPDTFFKLMSKAVDADYQALLNAKTMTKASETAFNYLANQVAHKYTLAHRNETIQGQIILRTHRLRIAVLPLWLMTGAFLTMILVSLVVLSGRPMHAVPSNIESIGAVSFIVARSENVQGLLQGTGMSNMDLIEQTLSNHRFRTTVLVSEGSIPKFVLEGQSPGLPSKSSATRRMIEWWRPFASRKPVAVLTLCIPVCLIVALEVLQRLCDQHDGIATIRNAGTFFSILYTRFLPALVMLSIATLYNTLDFTILTLAPYNALRSQCDAARSIRSSVLGKTPLHAFYTSIRHGHHGAMFSSVAALVGSALTIVVSGLYTVQDVPILKPIEVTRLDHFDTAWTNSVVNDNGASVISSLIESSVIGYPSFTFGELAIPTIQLTTSFSNLIANLGDQESKLSVRLPTLRSSLDCTVVPPSTYNVTGYYNSYSGESEGSLDARASLPADCLLGGIGGNLSYTEWGNSFIMPGNSSYVGQLIDLHTGPWEYDYDFGYNEIDFFNFQDNPPGCPSLALTFGYIMLDHITGDLRSSKSNVTTMMCYQRMQEIETNVTFTIPNLLISAESPPVPDESTVKYLSAGPSGATTFAYRPQMHFETQLSVFNQDKYDTESVQLDGYIYPFYQAVLLGKTPVDPALLTGFDSHERLFNATQAYYRRYMAQAISANMRVSVPEDTLGEVFIGSYIDPTNPRLFQNKGSKLALQVMLGVMVACGALAHSLTSMAKTLFHNPCSIAGMVSLLAGSEMCSERLASLLPDGVEWMTDKELDKHKVWNGWLFSIGWWDWKFGEQSRFGIDIGAAEKAS